MLKNFLAKLGVGAAKIDLVLNKSHFELGEMVEGQFNIQGGAVEQHINRIDADLEIQIRVKDRIISHNVATIPISPAFTIQPNEKKVLPFHYPLAIDMPISRGGVSYTFITRLDIAAGLDGSDSDKISIVAPARFEAIVQALDILGFREKHGSGSFNGYTQEFEFTPMRAFKGQVDEVEFEASIEPDGIRLLLEVDMLQLFGFSEKELKQEIFLTNDQLKDVHSLSKHLEGIIAEMLQNPHAYAASRIPKPHGHKHAHRGYGLSNAMGGMVAGLVGGLVLSAIFEAGAEALEGDEFGGEDDGGFFDFGDDGGGFED